MKKSIAALTFVLLLSLSSFAQTGYGHASYGDQPRHGVIRSLPKAAKATVKATVKVAKVATVTAVQTVEPSAKLAAKGAKVVGKAFVKIIY